MTQGPSVEPPDAPQAVSVRILVAEDEDSIRKNIVRLHKIEG